VIGWWRSPIIEVEELPVDISADELKQIAAAAALEQVRSGMLLGLGTGSTAARFVELLGRALAGGELEKIETVCTSSSTEQLAQRAGIPVVGFSSIYAVDLAIDGADELDPDLRLIKGRGGALLREKIVEQAAARFICIADESKLVERLGRGTLPVEIVRFASHHLSSRWSRQGLEVEFRGGAASPYVSDEGHHIVDLGVPASEPIETFVAWLRSHAGVVETGFFPTEATDVFIARAGGVERRSRS
jgi:ribose 5-phosphate isomerase A